MKSLLVLLFFVVVVVLVRCDDGEQITTLPYSVTPPNARLQAPCWRDIDGSERVAIFFDHAMLIDRVLLGGEESVGFRVRSRSLYLEPSFVQRLEYQCKGEETHLSAQQVNASFTCKDFFESFPPLNAAIPLECYNSTYVYLADILIVHGTSPTQCAQLIDTHCVATHSTVSNTTCPAVFQYTNGITNCDVSCRCAYFQPTVGTAPSLGATPPPTVLNCTPYYENLSPRDISGIAPECLNNPEIRLNTTYCFSLPPPPDTPICSLTKSPDFGGPCSTARNDSNSFCCTCIVKATSTNAPTSTPATPAPTALNCTQYFETHTFPFDPVVLEECQASIIILDCVPLNTTNTCPRCPDVQVPGVVCKPAVVTGSNCCIVISFTVTPSPTPQPTPSPTASPTLPPTLQPTASPTSSPTTSPPSPSFSPTPTSPAPTTITSSPTAPPSPTSTPSPTTSSPPPTTPAPTELSSPTTAAPTSGGGGSGLTTGEIIAIIFGVIVVVVIIGLFIAILCIRSQRGTITYYNRS